MYGYNYMKFNHHGHDIIVRKGFKYAIYDTEGKQIKNFR